MHKNIRKPYSLYVFHLPLLLLALALGGLAYLGYIGTTKNDKGTSVLGTKSNKGENSNSTLGAGKNKNKNTVETTNSQKFKKNMDNFVTSLEDVSDTEEQIGNTETSQEVQEVADSQEEETENVADAIGAVESRPKWKILLLGSDYKNLGKLRSSLVHVQNDIRKLSRNTDAVVDPSSETVLQAQLTALTAERNRIIDVIVDNKEQFSLLGWVVKLFSGTTTPPIGGGGDVEETTESTSGATE